MADVQLAIIDQQNTEVTVAVPGIQGIQGQTGDVAVAQDGTQGTPGIRFENDPNTGIYRPGDDQLAISTNGRQRVAIASDGSLTIGEENITNAVINAPESVFINIDSNDDDTGEAFVIGTNRTSTSGGTELLRVTEGGELKHIGGGTEGDPAVYFAGSAPAKSLYVRATTGKVGLGTSSPSTILHLNTDSGNNLQAFSLADSVKAYIGLSAVTNSPLVGAAINDLCFRSENANIRFGTASSTRSDLTIDSSGKVGVGTTNPTQKVQITDGTLSNFYIAPGYDGGAGTTIGVGGGEYLAFNGAPFTTERMRIDSSGRLLVGTTSTSADTRAIIQGRSSAPDSTGRLYISSGNNAPGDGDGIAELYFSSNAHVASARIATQRDGGTWTAGSSLPTRLVFSTTADGASSPTERMRITSTGDVFINKTTFSDSVQYQGITLNNGGDIRATTNNTTVGYFNRLGGDGELIAFYENTVKEGDISVSGTTVSYNGAHLSRWSQLLSGAERIEILRGTILSNIDEMCEWGEEDNEQLNRMKVSDVEGDKNVSGVFQAWDDDDETYVNDFYCAMTGDFIIRIAAGTTVERGDLLMSAGDGTAKPQDDDIIRSKTIAKVTSTNVSCTYDDGSYCVPCVLMAC